MTWTRLSDDFADSPEVLGLSDAAFRTHVTALIWSNRQLTDGVIPARALRLLTGDPDPERIVLELLAAGLWTEDGASYVLDWADQETSERIEERKRASAESSRKHRERKDRHARGDHSLCDRCSAVRDKSRDQARDASRDPSVTATRPDPSRPLGRDGEGTRAGARESEPTALAGASPSSPPEEIEADYDARMRALLERERDTVNRLIPWLSILLNQPCPGVGDLRRLIVEEQWVEDADDLKRWGRDLQSDAIRRAADDGVHPDVWADLPSSVQTTLSLNRVVHS